jgi:hypothetical protein
MERIKHIEKFEVIGIFVAKMRPDRKMKDNKWIIAILTDIRKHWGIAMKATRDRVRQTEWADLIQ